MWVAASETGGKQMQQPTPKRVECDWEIQEALNLNGIARAASAEQLFPEKALSLYSIKSVLMKQSILQNVVWKEGQYYVAQCLNIDISSFGETRTEALKNLDEAIGLFFE